MEKTLMQLQEQSVSFLQDMNISRFWSTVIQSIIVIFILLIVAWVADKFAAFLMRKIVPKLIKKTKTRWDDVLLRNKVFVKIAHFIPGLVIVFFYPLIASDEIRTFIEYTINSYFIIVFLLVISSFINSFADIYSSFRGEGEGDNIKIYLQLAKVVLYSLGGIAIVSIFANRNFIDILKGLGAMITVLLIVYKDTIMGFVAGIQLSANKMVKVGDWVSVDKHNADGTVTEISLNTVKVQNWDKTITTIPTYKLMSESFINWKGMEESGGRRIKRHINIDLDSIHFLTPEEIERLKRFELLKKYISDKLKELEASNKNEKETVNQRKLTNIGTFRKYIENYLLSTGYVNTEMTFIVRQLQPTELGVPIEIYMFCKEKAWVNYEGVQSDIFDHIFAVVPKFNLQIFQRTSNAAFKEKNGDLLT